MRCRFVGNLQCSRSGEIATVVAEDPTTVREFSEHSVRSRAEHPDFFCQFAELHRRGRARDGLE
ncbi:Uncharacterised protein [Mycobacteroides abscessus subsp. abscessus]|nr:Uncharacterised protein [Mycobacteroides abscessus subsp. abscessus]